MKIAQILQQYQNEDQVPRLIYKEIIDQIGDWKIARKIYIEKYNPKDPNNDFFDEKERQVNYKKFIIDNIKIISNNKKLACTAWVLVQHMDYDLEFQKWYFKLLKMTCNEEDQEYKLLYDRICVNEGLPQKYNTQFIG